MYYVNEYFQRLLISFPLKLEKKSFIKDVWTYYFLNNLVEYEYNFICCRLN